MASITTTWWYSLPFNLQVEGTEPPTQKQLLQAAIRALASQPGFRFEDAESEEDIGDYDPWGHMRPNDDPKEQYLRTGEA